MGDAHGQLRGACQRLVEGFDRLYGRDPVELRQVEDVWLELCQAVAECRVALAVLEGSHLSQHYPSSMRGSQ